jgi:recombination associated protein RdgC
MIVCLFYSLRPDRSKKIKLLDVVLDGGQEGGKDDDDFDTEAALLTGELALMLPDLLEALGGEAVDAASTGVATENAT